MPMYITLFKNTQKGAETIKDAPQRSAEGVKSVQAAGGRVIAGYATLGRYDYEFPDSKVAWPVLVKTAMRGTVSGETLEAIPIEEFIEIVKRA